MNNRIKILVIMGAVVVAFLAIPLLSGSGESAKARPAADSSAQAKPAASTSLPASHNTADTPAGFLAAGKAAKAQGELKLAEHYALALIKKRVSLSEALHVFWACRQERVEKLVATPDTEDRRSLKEAFDTAKKLVAQTQAITDQLLYEDLEEDRHLSTVDRSEMYKIQKAVQCYADGLVQKRRESFIAFAERHIYRAKEHYYDGKGSWYKNDDEDLFIKAIVELNFANAVLDELNEAVRAAIAEWHSKLKSELNPKSEYKRAMEQSRLILGTK